MCNKEDETIEHFLTKCTYYEAERQALKKNLCDVLQQNTNPRRDISTTDTLLQLILDCTHISVNNVIGKADVRAIERYSQIYCWKIDQKRREMLTEA